MPLIPSPTPLLGECAVITGAGRGIGRAIALQLAALGAHTVLCGRSVDPLRETAGAIARARQEDSPATSTVVACDVTDLPSVESLAATVARDFRRVDILVNNAGIGGASGPLHQLAPDTWDRVLNTNLRGVFYCLRSFVPLMIESGGGHIINISSLAGKNALPNAAAYSASKWALNGLTYSVAEELRAHNIRVSVICPGSVHTDFSPHAGKSTEKMLQPSDVAHAVAMLVTQAPQSFVSEILLRPTQKP